MTLLQPNVLTVPTLPTDGSLLGAFQSSPLERSSIAAMGLNPFFAAFALFSFWTAMIPSFRSIRNDSGRRWRYLAWLTGIVAAIEAISLTVFMVGGQRAIVTSTVGLLTVSALVFGTMTLFWLGRLIDEFGVPNGYGVWFLFGAQTLLGGVHHIARWVATDSRGESFALILLAYLVVSIALLASTVLVMQLVRPVIAHRADTKSERSGRTVFAFHLLEDGPIVPVAMATIAMSAIGIVEAIAAPVPAGIFDVALAVALVAACLIASRGAVDEPGLAKKLRREGW